MGIFSWVPQNKEPYLLRILSPPLSSSLLSLHTHVVVFTDRARPTRLQSPVCNLAKANCFHSHFFSKNASTSNFKRTVTPSNVPTKKKRTPAKDEDDDTTGASGWEFFLLPGGKCTCRRCSIDHLEIRDGATSHAARQQLSAQNLPFWGNRLPIGRT